MFLHRVEGAVAARVPLLQDGRVGLDAAVVEPEPRHGDLRLVIVLLEELPLQHLRALVAILRDVLRAVAEVPEDGVRLGERTAVVEHERWHAERRVQGAEDTGSVRPIRDRQLAPFERYSEVREQEPNLVAVA